MKALLITFFALISMSAYSAEIDKKPRVVSEYFYYKADDGISYATPSLDRSQWTKKYFSGLPKDLNNFWIQVDFDLTEERIRAQGVMIVALASYEAYWDGEFIGRNGQIGDSKDEEVPGQIESYLIIPSHLDSAGKHTLSLKLSSHHKGMGMSGGMFWAFVSDYEYLVAASYKQANLPLVMSGAMLLVGIYCLFLYLKASGNRVFLSFSSLCLLMLLLFIVESWRGFWGYSYDWHYPRLEAVTLLTLMVSANFVHFVLSFFCAIDKKFYTSRNWHIVLTLATMCLVIGGVDGYDSESLAVFIFGIVLSSLITAVAMAKKVQYARLMAASLLALASPVLIHPHFYMEQYFFLSFGVFVAMILYFLSCLLKDQQAQVTASKVNAARLEIELLKKNIQPHFILNTLTAVEEWIEENPRTAVKFIQALADEFRIMGETSGKTLVSLREEISLCQAHLQVLKYKTEHPIDLGVEAEDLQLQIPPGIILTLAENGITYNAQRLHDISFNISASVSDNWLHIVFICPYGQQSGNTGLGTGTGTRYIEARLEESFPGNWRFNQSIKGANWVSELLIPVTNDDNVSD